MTDIRPVAECSVTTPSKITTIDISSVFITYNKQVKLESLNKSQPPSTPRQSIYAPAAYDWSRDFKRLRGLLE